MCPETHQASNVHIFGPNDNFCSIFQVHHPNWIVKYLVENSLGRLWMLNNPNSLLINKAYEIYKNENLLKITNDPNTAVLGANVLYTDVWSSMGEENQKDEKEKVFNGFTIDSDLVSKADKDAIILHCLPAYRSKEITDEIFESHKSRIFDQAENRLHAQQALLSCLLQ